MCREWNYRVQQTVGIGEHGWRRPPSWDEYLPDPADLQLPIQEAAKTFEYNSAISSITALNTRLPLAQAGISALQTTMYSAKAALETAQFL